MKLIKKINNNFALAVDQNGEELIVEGKGIGFRQMPYQLEDLRLVQRTYYNFDPHYLDLIAELPPEVWEVSQKIINYAFATMHNELSTNAVFTLADHIYFAIKRYKQRMDLHLPFENDIQHLCPEEYKVAQYAVKLIKKELHVPLPDSELTGIAMNIINARVAARPDHDEEELNNWLSQIVMIVEDAMKIKIDKNSFNYSRFVSHIQYLYLRVNESKQISTQNKQIYESLVERFPKTNDSVIRIADFLKARYQITLGEEERLYLILHINRLCSREGL